MFANNPPHFSLGNFEGPLELLLHLIQKEEMDVCDIALKELTLQCLESLEGMNSVDTGAEWLSLTTTLLLLKSRKLLPFETVHEESEEPPRSELINKLLEYYRFKEAAQELSTREEEQKVFFTREYTPSSKARSPGLEEVNLEDLNQILLQVLEKAKQHPQQLIQEEEWQVTPKVEWFREALSHGASLPLKEVFSLDKSRGELIVLFLALLELMKTQEAKVYKEAQNQLLICKL